MTDADVRMGLYLLVNDLNALAINYKKEILAHYKTNQIVTSIVQLASEGLCEPSADDLNLRLQCKDVNPIFIDRILTVYSELDRNETIIKGIRHFYKNIITSKLIDKASEITDLDKYTAEITRIGKLDFGEGSIYDQAVKSKKFSELDIKEMEASMDKVVPSFWKPLNESNPYGGYREEQLVTICGAPGCFFGDTKVLTLAYGIITLKQLHEKNCHNIVVKSYNANSIRAFQDKFEWKTAKECVITKYITTYCQVTLNGKYTFRCTLDHPIKLYGKGYVEASRLRHGDVLEEYSHCLFRTRTLNSDQWIKVTKVEILESEDEIPVYDLVEVEDHHNFVVIPIEYGRNEYLGFVAHNSGKSFFMMQELIKNIEAGRHCIYCAIGDLIEEDFIVRLAALKFRVPLSDIYLDFRYYQKRLLEEMPQIEKLSILFIKPGKLSASDLQNYLEENEFKDERTTFFIDYDSNLNGNESLYMKGDEIYCVAEAMAARPGYLGFIATQPKIMYFGAETFGMDGLGESSRKAHISATIITLGVNQNAVNPVGYINICKQRRGVKFIAPYFRDLNGEFLMVSEQQKSELAQFAMRRTMVCQTSDASRYDAGQ